MRAVLIDAAGREVAVLHDGEQPAGAYALNFETAALAAGVYAVRISDGTTAVARTVTVVRWAARHRPATNGTPRRSDERRGVVPRTGFEPVYPP